MPLVTAARFPGLFAQPSNRGLTEGINQAFGHVSDTMRLNKIMEAKANQATLDNRAGLFQYLRGIEDPDKRYSMFMKLANDAAARKEPGMEDYYGGIGIDNPDEFGLYLSTIATRRGAEPIKGVALSDNERLANPHTGATMGPEPVKEKGFEEILDDDGTPLAQKNLDNNEYIKHPLASKLMSEQEFDQKIELIKARETAAANAQALTPLGQAALRGAQLDITRLEEGIATSKQKRLNASTEAAADKEAKGVSMATVRNEALGAIDIINDLLLDKKFSHAFGRFNTGFPEIMRPQATIDAKAQVDRVSGLLTLESRQKLKGSGTISDNEAKTLEKSASVLANPLIGDELVERELNRVKVIFQDVAERSTKKKKMSELTPAELDTMSIEELEALKVSE